MNLSLFKAKNLTIENTKYDKFANVTLSKINYSASRCNKYFKDQKPYSGKQLFVDPIFPPNNDSIFGLDNNGKSLDPNQERRKEAEEDFQIDANDIVWLRPTEIFGSEYALFEGQIEFDDVRQGSIGNCYFMASLSAMTENPDVIVEIYRFHNVQENGYYEICLKIDGVWNIVILDDCIPCSKRTKKPIFANPKGNELWAVLLEKAWAKVNGGYIFTVAGVASEVIECITNFPFEYNTITPKNEDEIWNKILYASGNSYVMTTALPPNEQATDLGLVTGHEYTLTFGQEEIIDGKKIRLLKVRNPWGSTNYIGDWGEKSSLWTDEAKRKFDYKSTYDGQGEFFIDWNTFNDIFVDVDICKIESRICMKQDLIAYEKSLVPTAYHLRIFEEAMITITIFKPYYRFCRNLPTDWTVTQQIFFAKCNDKEKFDFSEYVGEFEGQNDCSLTLTLKPGTYFFYAFVNWSSAKDLNGVPIDLEILKNLQVCVSVFSSEFFGFNKVEEKGMALFYRIVIDYARKNPEEVQNFLNIKHMHNWVNSEFYFIYVKSLKEKPIEISIILNNIELHGITTDLKTITNVLYHEQEMVLVFSCQQLFEAHGMGFGYKYKSTMQDRKELLPEMEPIPEYNLKSKNIENYSWIYKKNDDFDFKNILKQIDVSDAAFKNFKTQYPKDIEQIEAVPKVENHFELNLFVQDKIDFGDGEWYLGEWKDDDGLKMWGRGKAFLNGKTFIGQFINHNFTGVGKMILENGDVLDGNFENFNPKGTITFTHNDGRVEQKIYN